MATAAAASRATAEADRAHDSGAAHASAAAKRLQAHAKRKHHHAKHDGHHRPHGHQHDPAHPLAAPERSALLARTGIQPALLISQPGDAAEAEADRVADRVVAMKEPPAAPARAHGGALQRSPLVVQRAPAPPTPQPAAENVADAATEAAVKAELSGGAPMAADVASFFGRRFGANFGDVRIHTDDKAANLSTRLGARAFTYGRHVFFNGGQYNPDSEEGSKLIAHELAHTIQQSAVIQLKEDAAAPPRVTSRSAPQAQRGIISRALNWIADKANYIPGFRLFTIVIGVNPINMSTVERSGANILRALIEFIPGGGLIVDALNNHGIFEKGGKFIEDQFHSLGMVGAAFRDALMEFIDSLSWSDVFHLGDVWDRAKRIFTAPVDKLIAFGKGLVVGIAQIVRDAILKPLGRYAASIIPKFDMLAGVFGKNPISGESVSPANALIGGFMSLIGQEELWANIQKSGAVGKAWNWFKGALSGALALVRTIPDRFVSTLKSLTIFDIVTIVGAWAKFAKLFLGFIVDFGGWALKQVLKLLEIILEVVAPSVIPYLKKAGAAFNTIIKAPGRFIGYLVQAGKAGFNMFKTNILKHLQKGILDWLLGSLAGANLYIPKSFDLRELLKFGLSVIGATWANVREKLVKATNETTVKVLETTFDIVKTLVTEGPAAAWQQLLETLSNLKSMVMDAIIDYVKGKVIEIAIEKVLSFLNPAGAFIQALLAIYRTISFVVGKLQQIGAVVAALIDGIAAIASGNIGPASAKVESVLAQGLSLAINFLANFAGLGNVSKKVIEVINKIRKPVDSALDKLVNWVVDKAKKAGKKILQAGVPSDPGQRVTLAIRDATTIAKGLSKVSKPALETAFAVLKTRYGLNGLEVFQRDGAWWARAIINPKAEGPVIKPTALGKAIEPILVTVETAWFIELDDNMDEKEVKQVAKGRADIEKGGKRGIVQLGANVSPESEIKMYRDIASNVESEKLTINVSKTKTMLAAVQIRGGGYETGGTYVNEPSNQGRNFVTGAKRYEEGIPEHVERVEEETRRRRTKAIKAEVASDTSVAGKDRRRAVEAQIQSETLENLSGGHRRLTERVEPARSEGMLTARKVAVGLVSTGQATAAEVTHGDLNPMAFEGASGKQMNNADNKAERHRRIGELIQKLRGAAAKLNLPGPVGAEIQQLAAAVNAWLTARGKTLKGKGKDSKARKNAFNQAAAALVDAFLAFLRQQRR